MKLHLCSFLFSFSEPWQEYVKNAHTYLYAFTCVCMYTHLALTCIINIYSVHKHCKNGYSVFEIPLDRITRSISGANTVLACISYLGTYPHSKMVYSSKMYPLCSQDIYFSNSCLDVNVMWFRGVYLLYPRAAAHFRDDSSDVMLWPLIPFNWFTPPFVSDRPWNGTDTATGVCLPLYPCSRPLSLVVTELIFNSKL